jgi:hypothetical protein
VFWRVHTGDVRLTVPDPDLCALLASEALLARTWPNQWQEAQMLIHALKIADPTLTQALQTSLVRVTPTRRTPGRGERSSGRGTTIDLIHRGVTMSARALTLNGSPVEDAASNPAKVQWLDVRDFTAAGLSGLGSAE